ncbi:MAG: hypothetical protein HUU22_17095 [Phycisphaerae bacterium]|nr:hypothetical protein [Phycisphaerae bacterium]NUQ47738.1 hypothetical protein [Phycisphaerae bacterium]
MTSKRIRAFATTACVATLFGVAGCGLLFNPFVDPRLTDGGGGNLLTASLKALGGQMTQLTQDEMQFLSDQTRALILAVDPAAPVLPPMTNEQADAVVNFLDSNNLDGLEDLATLAEQAEADPGSIQGLDQLADAYADTVAGFDADEATQEDLDELFDAIFGGVQ